jgi:unsaturated chondroitin disaccharide hydrolase
MARFRGVQLLGLGLALAAILAAAPAAASAETAFDYRMRLARGSATSRVMATEKRIRPGLFTYYAPGTSWATSGPSGWASGYLPGELWAAYSLSGDGWFSDRAKTRQTPLKSSIISGWPDDTGMRFFYSHVRAYQMTGNTSSRNLAFAAAEGEAMRFSPIIGAIRSRIGSETVAVIVDELVNLEILYWGAENGGPSYWRDFAQLHARTTARDFIREDGSVRHMVYYNPITGEVVNASKGGGYSPDSAWARGQAWAIHGFSNSYRHTGDPVLLAAARKVADHYLAELPADMVPYWDFDAPGIPNEPRDSSAAAIAASGLLDLAQLDPVPENRVRYEAAARATLLSLASPAYFSAGGNPAILLHGTQNYHSGMGVDSGLAFGDYFFLESLQRLRRFPAAEPAFRVRRLRASKGKPYRASDGKLSTWWASTGNQWIEFDLGKRRTASAVSLAIRSGTSRSAKFKIYTSNDRRRWKHVASARSSAETLEPETYTFKPTRARYVRVVCSGTSRTKANEITEAAVR